MTGRPRPASRLGVVSNRRRLAAAAGVSVHEAPALLRAQVEGAAAAGVAFFQLREADLGAIMLVDLARDLLRVASGRTRIVVNDRADVAAAAGADLHLKHSSIAAAALRAWLPAGIWVSRAVHTVDDVRTAGPVDAFIAGTAAPSVSKHPGGPTLGRAGLTAIAGASAVPVFAIGGLAPRDWAWVADCGVHGIAGIGAFLPAPGEDAASAVTRAVAAFVAAID